MADEEKVVDAEVTEEKPTEEKKESKWSKFWAGAKKSVNDSLLESHLQSTWNDKKPNFSVYGPKNGAFGAKTFRGVITDNEVIYYVHNDEKGVEVNTVLLDEVTKKAYYVTGCEKEAVVINYEGQDYERSGYKLTLNPDVKEVSVIKAGDKYYLNPGE